jgi:hypothetical protein
MAQTAAKTDPLSAYTICVTAAYAELIARYPNPTESMARARIACGKLRTVLENDVRKRAGKSTRDVMLKIDVEILKTLRG